MYDFCYDNGFDFRINRCVNNYEFGKLNFYMRKCKKKFLKFIKLFCYFIEFK